MNNPKASAPIEIPDHVLLRLIARGSYGEVWLARNIMGTHRAVKIVRRATFEDETPFLRELAGIQKFEPVSRGHDGLVDILHVGKRDHEGLFFYVMELADDLETGQSVNPDTYQPKTLATELARKPRFSVEECIHCGMALCQALERLHEHGLVHRDIKPSNIVIINGAPKLADIGLVTEFRNAQSLVGTVGFIPPEGPGSAKADIYSLGKVLYEIATGRDRQDFPDLPTKFPDFTDHESFLELNEVLLKACRNHPDDRYENAREMFGDLALLASGKSLRRLRALERKLKKFRRAAVFGIAASLLFAAVGFALNRAQQQARQNLARELGAHSARGIQHMNEGDFLGALPEFAEMFRLDAENSTRTKIHRTRIASLLASAPRLTQMLFFKGAIRYLQFNSNGTAILVSENPGSVHLCDALSGKELVKPFGLLRPTQSTFTANSNLVLLAAEHTRVSLWDISTGKERLGLEHSDKVFSARFSPSEKLLATAAKDGVIRIWDPSLTNAVLEWKGHSRAAKTVEFSPDERYLLSAGDDSLAFIWDVKTGACLSQPMKHSRSWVVSASFSPNAKVVATAGHDNWARLWKVPSGEELPSRIEHDNRLSRVAYSPDGRIIATASFDSTVRLWDAATSMPLKQNHLLRHSSAVLALAFSPDGRQIATGCSDGTVRIWDLATAGIDPVSVSGTVNSEGTFFAERRPRDVLVKATGTKKFAATIPAPKGQIEAFALSNNGQALAMLVRSSESPDRTVITWRTSPVNQGPSISVQNDGRISNLKLSPDGRWLGFIDQAKLALYQVDAGTPWSLEKEVSEGDPHFVFSPTAGMVAVANGRLLKVFETATKRPKFPDFTLDGPIREIVFSPSESKLAVCRSDDFVAPQAVDLIDLRTGTVETNRLWHRDGVIAASFRFDEERLVTGGEDRAAIVWNIRQLKAVFAPFQHREQVYSVKFSPSGNRIGTTSQNQTVRLWDAEMGIPITPELPTRQRDLEFVFLQGEDEFATRSTNSVSMWRIPPEEHSAEDLLKLGQFLTSSLSLDGPSSSDSLEAAWKETKLKFPARLHVTREDCVRWHQRELQNAQRDSAAFAALFHARWLCKLSPENEGFQRERRSLESRVEPVWQR